MPESAEDFLREHGLQVTAQRLAVLEAVSDRPHATVDELIELVRDSIGAVSRQAVYDTLGILVEKGVVRRIQPAGSHRCRLGQSGTCRAVRSRFRP